MKGESDLVGYDGETLAFVEVWTRTARVDQAALPEVSVTAEKRHLVGRTRAAVSDGTARERVSGAVPCGGDRRVTGPSAAGTACTRTLLTRGCKKPRWK